MISHNVTLLKASSGEWRRIESGESRFELCNRPAPYDTVAFMFIDTTTEEHLGNALILSETTFGGWDNGSWTWSMFAKITGMTVRELKKRFPFEAKAKCPSDYEMYLYEVKPISDTELLQHLCSPNE